MLNDQRVFHVLDGKHLMDILVGGAIIILKHMKVNGKDYPFIFIMDNHIHVPNHQSANIWQK
jgi:hypothetical protein